MTFLPTDDAYVRSPYPNENSGAQPTLRTYTKLPIETHSYLKFSVGGITGPVSSVKLRLHVSDGSATAGKIYGVGDTTWSENAITWATKPAGGALLASALCSPRPWSFAISTPSPDRPLQPCIKDAARRRW